MLAFVDKFRYTVPTTYYIFLEAPVVIASRFVDAIKAGGNAHRIKLSGDILMTIYDFAFLIVKNPLDTTSIPSDVTHILMATKNFIENIPQGLQLPFRNLDLFSVTI